MNQLRKPDPGPRNVEFSFRQMKQWWESDRPKRVHAQEKRLMFSNTWKEQLDREMKKLFDNSTYKKIKQRQDTSVNIFRWSIRERSGIYSKRVKRKFVDQTYDANGNLQNVHTSYIEDMPELDMSMQKACDWSEASGETLVRTTWAAGRMQANIYPRDCFYAVAKADDPLALALVIIEHRNDDGKATHYEVWTDEQRLMLNLSFERIDQTQEYRYHKGDPDSISEENPFGLVPFIVMHYEYPAAEFWHGYASDDLQEACKSMGVDLTDFAHIKHFQSYKQLFIKKDGSGESKAQVFKTDASAVLEGGGPNADAKVLDMQANLLAHLEVTLKKVQFTLGLMGLRPTLLHGDTQVESGFALMVREFKKRAYQDELRQLRTLDENQLWKIARVVVPMEGGPEIPEGKLVIDWPEIGPGGNPIEMAQFVQTLGDLLSADNALRELGKSEEYIQQNNEEKAAQGANTPDPNIPGVPTGPGNDPGGDM